VERQFTLSPEVTKLLLELSEKTKQLGSALESGATMLEEIANVDFTDELGRKMKTSEATSNQLIDDIGNLRNKIKKLDKRFKNII
jgi:hypothetical protein